MEKNGVFELLWILHAFSEKFTESWNSQDWFCGKSNRISRATQRKKTKNILKFKYSQLKKWGTLYQNQLTNKEFIRQNYSSFFYATLFSLTSRAQNWSAFIQPVIWRLDVDKHHGIKMNKSTLLLLNFFLVCARCLNITLNDGSTYIGDTDGSNQPHGFGKLIKDTGELYEWVKKILDERSFSISLLYQGPVWIWQHHWKWNFCVERW